MGKTRPVMLPIWSLQMSAICVVNFWKIKLKYQVIEVNLSSEGHKFSRNFPLSFDITNCVAFLELYDVGRDQEKKRDTPTKLYIPSTLNTDYLL